jgi:MOSC domain-containing protein YiiM
MKIASINLAQAEPLQGGRTPKDGYPTGIYKRPVDGPVRVTRDGLPGDYIGNLTYHGGPDQAVYLYALSDYRWWESTLGRSLEPGAFGENLTLDQLDTPALAIGDRFRINGVLLEVTSPRIPCATLSRRMDDPAFLKKFRAAERPGAYCRVLEEGEIRPGDPVRHEPYPGEKLSLLEIYRTEFSPPNDTATLRRHLAAPLAIRLRAAKEKRLATLTAESAR